MTISRSRAALALLAAVAVSACSGQAGADAKSVARHFCAAVLKGDEARAVALMTPDLQDQVAGLKLFDAGWRARNPDQKPPLGDGLRLTAWQDAPGACTPGAPTGDTVVLTYAPASAPAEQWRDTLVLARVAGRLRVTDIRYDAGTGGQFRTWLDEALQSPG
jgi:hypothetical protein